MPQVTQLQGDNSNLQDAQIATQTLGETMRNIRKKEREQSSALNQLRVKLLAKPDKFQTGTAVSANVDGTIVGNDIFNQAMALKKAELQSEPGFAPIVNISNEEGNKAALLQEQGIRTVAASTTVNRKSAEAVANEMINVLPISESMSKLKGTSSQDIQDRTTIGMQTAKDIVAPLQDLGEDNIDKPMQSITTDKSLPLNEPNKSKTAITAKAGAGEKASFSLDSSGKWQGGEVKYKPTITTIQDKGISIKDEMPYTMESLMDSADLLQIGAGDNYNANNNPYLMMANQRQSFLNDYAKQQSDRIQQSVKQGEVEVKAPTADYSSKVSEGMGTNIYYGGSKIDMRSSDKKEKIPTATDASGHDMVATGQEFKFQNISYPERASTTVDVAPSQVTSSEFASNWILSDRDGKLPANSVWTYNSGTGQSEPNPKIKTVFDLQQLLKNPPTTGVSFKSKSGQDLIYRKPQQDASGKQMGLNHNLTTTDGSNIRATGGQLNTLGGRGIQANAPKGQNPLQLGE